MSSTMSATEPDERLLDVLGQLVDDAVGPDVDALALGELLRSEFGRTLKPTTIALERPRQHDVDSTMPPTPVWMTRTATSSCLIFSSSETAASADPCTSP
jgi:hypothetical protein